MSVDVEDAEYEDEEEEDEEGEPVSHIITSISVHHSVLGLAVVRTRWSS